jgi:hypothetical protein
MLKEKETGMRKDGQALLAAKDFAQLNLFSLSHFLPSMLSHAGLQQAQPPCRAYSTKGAIRSLSEHPGHSVLSASRTRAFQLALPVCLADNDYSNQKTTLSISPC